MTGLTIKLGSSGDTSLDVAFRNLLGTIKNLEPELRKEIDRQALAEVVDPLAREMRYRAWGLGSHAARTADSLRTNPARGGPTITVGPTSKAKVTGDIVFGAEFGGDVRVNPSYGAVSRRGRRYRVRGRHTTAQFEWHTGRAGRFVYPTLRARVEQTMRAWGDLADKVLQRAARGGE